ncbi:MAG: hypothetical protein H0V81_03225 [Solirubrobacterales bacterium]|nr:hypothetical protein [Solirubrobacterales bacterium]
MYRPLLIVLAVCLVFVASASAHPERPTAFPTGDADVPKYRSKGPSQVVCKADSRKRIQKAFRGKGPKNTRLRKVRYRVLKRCKFEHIQAAVDAAKSGDRILILPGVYKEEPSRAFEHNKPSCGELFDPGDGHGKYATYAYQLKCPNSRNLIFIGGDQNDDGTCDEKCDLQVEGLGRKPTDVLIEGDRLKEDVIRADRADGIYIKNVHTDQGSFNAIDVVETNGFRLGDLEATWSQNYGVLSFTSDNGLYEDIEAYGNGDSGIYPGSGPETHCNGYGIEIRRVNSHGNVLGYSGTAGNGTFVHDSNFSNNSAGISDDSFASGHPGMPQDCSKWEGNKINSNNVNYFELDNQQYCAKTPFEDRPRERVCPQFQVPVGSGFILYGVNDNLFINNEITDNWRSGARLFWVPATIRGENDPAKQTDTSNGNKFMGNMMGVTMSGERAPNGIDFFWDEQGERNCWQANKAFGDQQPTSDPAPLPSCPGSPFKLVGNISKLAQEVPCATWNPDTNQMPVGCTWFTTPPKPR